MILTGGNPAYSTWSIIFMTVTILTLSGKVTSAMRHQAGQGLVAPIFAFTSIANAKIAPPALQRHLAMVYDQWLQKTCTSSLAVSMV